MGWKIEMKQTERWSNHKQPMMQRFVNIGTNRQEHYTIDRQHLSLEEGEITV